jgi:hypothetical protein
LRKSAGWTWSLDKVGASAEGGCGVGQPLAEGAEDRAVVQSDGEVEGVPGA